MTDLDIKKVVCGLMVLIPISLLKIIISAWLLCVLQKIAVRVPRLPEHAGLLVWYHTGSYSRVKCVRVPKKQSDYRCSDKERSDFLRLCYLRMWSLKAKLLKISKKVGRGR